MIITTAAAAAAATAVRPPPPTCCVVWWGVVEGCAWPPQPTTWDHHSNPCLHEGNTTPHTGGGGV